MLLKKKLIKSTYKTIIGSLVIYYVVFIYKNRKFLKFARNHNVFFWPPVLPIIGTIYCGLLAVLFSGLPVNLLSTLQWGKHHFGYPNSFWFGTAYFYITSNPDEIRIICNHPKCYNKGKAYEILSLIFPNSIVLTPYETWKPKRKLLQNSYKPSVIKTFVPTFYKQSCKLLEDIKTLNKINDPFDYFSEYAFVNYFLTSAGLEEEKCYPDLKKIGDIIRRIQDDLISKMLDPIIPLNIWQRFFPIGRRFTKDNKELICIITGLIKQKQQQYSTRKVSANDDKAMPLFDLIVNSVSKNIDDKEIFEDITFLTAAATETAGNALAFCFMLLGMHPEIQETLYKEIINVVSRNPISSDDLSNLKYTEAVIQESLRLFPPVPLVQRHVGEDVDLGTQVIPEGANFTIDILHLHRDEKYWPNPLKFDPTRFLAENASKIYPYTYLPFSAGPRDCLGKNQAMAVLKTTVATVIRELKVTSSQKSIEEIQLTSLITMKPAHPIDCQFSLRLV